MDDFFSHRDYMTIFWRHVSNYLDRRDPLRCGWIATEDELRRTHGKVRYRTYAAFRRGKCRGPLRARLTFPR